MIRQLNAGCLLPVFAEKAYQAHKFYGLHWSQTPIQCRRTRGQPFQFLLPAGNSGASPVLTAVNAGDETVTQGIPSGFSVDALVGGRAFFTFFYMGSGTLPVGFWFWKIECGGEDFFSDVFEVVDETCFDSWAELEFWHEKDKGGILYQTDFKQILGLANAVWDAPQIEREIDSAVNGNGVETTRFARTVENGAFEAALLPDGVLNALAQIREHSNVQIRWLPSERVDILKNCTFEPRRVGAFSHAGRFTFEAERDQFTGCQENFELA